MGGVVRSTFTPRRNSNNISVFLSQLAQITNELHHVNNTQHHHAHAQRTQGDYNFYSFTVNGAPEGSGVQNLQ